MTSSKHDETEPLAERPATGYERPSVIHKREALERAVVIRAKMIDQIVQRINDAIKAAAVEQSTARLLVRIPVNQIEPHLREEVISLCAASGWSASFFDKHLELR